MIPATNEETLCHALRRSLGVRVSIERKGDWGLSMVPILRAEGAWKDDHLDAYWRAFMDFCRWPEWKETARLEVYDSTPTSAGTNTKRIVLFYRGDLRRLSALVTFDNGTPDQSKVLNEVSLQKLYGIRTFGDLLLL